MQRIAIFGGSFNPVHWGHLLIAEAAFSQILLDQVIWVPTCYPPHKSSSLLAFQHRFEMVGLATADHPAFKVSDVDTRQQEISYAIATLEALKSDYPNTHWYWIVGLDAFQTLPKWYRREELAAQCTWLVAPRFLRPEEMASDHELSSAAACLQICQQVSDSLSAQSMPIRWVLLQAPWVGISSSLIRDYCQRGHSIRYLVPEAIRRYIAMHKLYK